MTVAAFILHLVLALLPAGIQNASLPPGEAARQQLPPPQHLQQDTLDQALRERRSSRAFAATLPDLQELSNLLWATMGINRPESGKRVWPSSRNVQDLKLIVILPQGHFRYDPVRHVLLALPSKGLPAALKTQPFVEGTPVHLLFCSDASAYPPQTPDTARIQAAFFHAGCASQNCSLYCATHGMATLVRTYFDPLALARELALPPQERILVHQLVGYPAP